MLAANPESRPTDAEPTDPYDPEALGHMWVATYRIAQGSAGLQHDVVRLLYEDVLPPEVREDDGRLEQSFAIARPLVRRIVNSAGHTKYTDLSQGSVDRNFESDVVNPIRKKYKKPTLNKLLEKILARDARYLPDWGNKTPRTYGAGHGEYFSHAIRYILLQAKTPHPGIDQLFARTRPHFGPLAHTVMMASITKPEISDEPIGVPKDFTLQDVVSAHIVGSPGDAEPIQEALDELNISGLSLDTEPVLATAA